ncbi:hypothetical protein [Paenibacillus sp. AD87]|uniref:hypothetical protein n=1 Tax=Paenibacillus sp. AD87 TaxID=1528787 RepID=UPI0007E34B73|nr:hypothetical protein [Paenibacillus sp. AD87]OAX47668.1 Maleate isomerase [Paenibacillus sp. AD87]
MNKKMKVLLSVLLMITTLVFVYMRYFHPFPKDIEVIQITPSSNITSSQEVLTTMRKAFPKIPDPQVSYHSIHKIFSSQ